MSPLTEHWELGGVQSAKTGSPLQFNLLCWSKAPALYAPDMGGPLGLWALCSVPQTLVPHPLRPPRSSILALMTTGQALPSMFHYIWVFHSLSN